jgi:hypothetical protein
MRTIEVSPVTVYATPAFDFRVFAYITVKNITNTTQTFNVYGRLEGPESEIFCYWFDSTYSTVPEITLSPGTSKTLEFVSWAPNKVGTYNGYWRVGKFDKQAGRWTEIWDEVINPGCVVALEATWLQELLQPSFKHGIAFDNIAVSHELKFCKPKPGTWPCLPGPDVYSCGNYVMYLSDHPANVLPSGGVCREGETITVNQSEMAYLRWQINGPSSSGQVTTYWVERSTSRIMSSFTWNTPQLNNNQYTYSYSFVGRFPGEIERPGYYHAIVRTTWGNARIDFEVK